MAKEKYLTYDEKHGYRFVFMVPQDIREAFGKTAITKTLRTHDLDKARAIRDYLLHEAIEELRSLDRSLRPFGAVPASRATLRRDTTIRVNTDDTVRSVIASHIDPSQPYAATLREFAKAVSGNVGDITEDVVRDFIESYRVAGDREPRAGTRAKLLEHIRAFWSQCEDEIGRKVSLHFQGLKVPRAGRIPREPLTDEEFNELYRAATNPELKRAMLLARREGLTPKQMQDLVVLDTGKVVSSGTGQAFEPRSPEGKRIVSNTPKGPVLGITRNSLAVSFSALKKRLGFDESTVFMSILKAEE